MADVSIGLIVSLLWEAVSQMEQDPSDDFWSV
jgi:hypothetical protein